MRHGEGAGGARQARSGRDRRREPPRSECDGQYTWSPLKQTQRSVEKGTIEDSMAMRPRGARKVLGGLGRAAQRDVFVWKRSGRRIDRARLLQADEGVKREAQYRIDTCTYKRATCPARWRRNAAEHWASAHILEHKRFRITCISAMFSIDIRFRYVVDR